MNNLEVSLSFQSFIVSRFSIYKNELTNRTFTFEAIFLMRADPMQFISIGSLTTSLILSAMNSIHSSTNYAIWRKSEEIRIEITLFNSSLGFSGSFLWMNRINQSKIYISQCTEMSMSSIELAPLRYLSKYFMWVNKIDFSHLKSLFTFLFSSQTWITTISFPLRFKFAAYWLVGVETLSWVGGLELVLVDERSFDGFDFESLWTFG